MDRFIISIHSTIVSKRPHRGKLTFNAMYCRSDDCRAFASTHGWEACARAFIDNVAADAGRPRKLTPQPRTLMKAGDLNLAALRRGALSSAMSKSESESRIVTLADIDAAAWTIAPFAVRTPLLSSSVLDDAVGGRVFLKPEILQRTGSFKFRGAFNKLSSIPAAVRAAGVVAFSSGNHAQGVAAAAQIFGIPATIVMPADAPALKRQRTKAFGAEVVLYDRDREDREAIARDLCRKRGATLVPPYDDPAIIAGQGTVGREIAEDLAALGVSPDVVAAPASGGGLVAGIATAVKARFPQASILAAEPEDFDDHTRSLANGRREAHHAKGRTICDALMAAMPGELTFAINHRLGVAGVTVSDDQVLAAMRFAYLELKLVVEPGGATPLAALLSGRIDAKDMIVVIVLSGGNVEPELFARAIA